MTINPKDRDFLKKHIPGSDMLIRMNAVGDLLVLIEDAIVEEEIAGDGELGPKGQKLQRIYDFIDSNN